MKRGGPIQRKSWLRSNKEKKPKIERIPLPFARPCEVKKEPVAIYRNRNYDEINNSVIGDTELPKRFWKKVMPRESGCWEWTGATSSSTSGTRYGIMTVNQKQYGAHRISWILRRGRITDGMDLDHLCRNTICVNPDHLEEVTHAENTRRGNAGMWFKELQNSKTHCPKGHPYDEDNTRYKPQGWRVCKECGREDIRNRRDAKRELRTNVPETKG